jgi:cell filamentation protein
MPDRYTYPDSEVLINAKGIRESKAARLAESQWVALRAQQIAALRGPFDQARLQKTHEAHFGGFYDWAGKIRTEGMMFKQRESGQAVQYPPSGRVEAYIANTFQQLKSENNLKGLSQEKIADRLSYYYSELDAAHPFRDGNSRTIRQFIADLAASAGYRLDWPRASATAQGIEAIYVARDAAVMRGDTSKLTEIIRKHIAAIGKEQQ